MEPFISYNEIVMPNLQRFQIESNEAGSQIIRKQLDNSTGNDGNYSNWVTKYVVKDEVQAGPMPRYAVITMKNLRLYR